MATWEYKVQQLVNYFDGDTYIDRLTEALDEAGGNQWELVTTQRTGDGVLADLLIFKRQLED
jgi:hypothetical protein